MQRKDNHSLFCELREKYPVFTFESYSVSPASHTVIIEFSFNISDTFHFKPGLIIPVKPFFNTGIIDSPLFHKIVLHIGMIEMISYWKATCSPKIIISPLHLDQQQIAWWKKLFYHGLGEFLYSNSILTDEEDLVQISSAGPLIPETDSVNLEDGYVIPAGGGKDSCVSLLLLKGFPGYPFILNPRRAITQTLSLSGFREDESVVFYRSIHPQLLELNQKGFLNGHTPFSALLAFDSLLASLLTGYRHIALSNESSANEATIPHTTINHQYSKTFEFEKDFRDYCRNYISEEFDYFSLLRPLNELQIARLFSGMKDFFPYFQSCNEGSKSDSWCGRCAKCLFTYIILSPFLTESELIRIFGYNLLDNYLLKDVFDQLTGLSGEKPFECVGTIHEVNAALGILVNKTPPGKLPALLRHYQSGPINVTPDNTPPWETLLGNYNPFNFVPPDLQEIINKALYG